MDLEISQAFKKECTCSICLKYLMDPVTIGSGTAFFLPFLCLSWEQVQTPACFPVCREPSQQKYVKNNILLKNLMSTSRKATLRKFLSSSKMCVIYKETKMIFSEENKPLLCLLCSSSQEQRAQGHPSVEGAAEEYQE
nr:tripartite motif-containing protein 43-like [Marmota flaviventris]